MIGNSRSSGHSRDALPNVSRLRCLDSDQYATSAEDRPFRDHHARHPPPAGHRARGGVRAGLGLRLALGTDQDQAPQALTAIIIGALVVVLGVYASGARQAYRDIRSWSAQGRGLWRDLAHYGVRTLGLAVLLIIVLIALR